MRSTLQSCLELLNRQHDRLNSAYKEILEIRIRITEILASCQSEVAMGSEDAWDSTAHLQVILGDEPHTVAPVVFNERDVISVSSSPLDHSLFPQSLAFHGQLSDQDYGPFSRGSDEVTSILPEGADPPVDQLFQGKLAIFTACFESLPCADTVISVSHDELEQPFQSFVPQQDTCPEGQTLTGSSARRHQQLRLPIVQGGQEKVKCTWPGCSRDINKDNHTRHVNETHLRKVKAFCTYCGRAFPRTYLNRQHELTCPGRH